MKLGAAPTRPRRRSRPAGKPPTETAAPRAPLRNGGRCAVGLAALGLVVTGATSPRAAEAPGPPSAAHGGEPGSDVAKPGASAETSVWTDRPVAFEVRGGLLSSVGVGGGAMSYSPVPELALELGLGSSIAGVRGMTGLRVRPAHTRHHAFTLHAEVSLGRWEEPVVCWECQGTEPAVWTPAVMLHAGLGYEYRDEGGFLFRAQGGLVAFANAGAVDTHQRDLPRIAAGTSLSFGYAFGD